MRPWWNSSSMLTQRNNVVLPEPLEPMIETTSPVASWRSTPFRTSTSLNFLCRFSIWRIGCAMKRSVLAGQRDTALGRLGGALDRIVDEEIDQAGDQIELECHEGARDDLLGHQQQLGNADDRQESRRLDHLRRRVDPGRQRLAQRLRG